MNRHSNCILENIVDEERVGVSNRVSLKCLKNNYYNIKILHIDLQISKKVLINQQ